MNKKILYYGNCQLGALRFTIGAANNSKYIPCYLTDITEDEFLLEIKSFDIIITQPISDSYKDKLYLSTKFIIDNCNKDCIIFIMPSIYFNFYYFDSISKTYKDKMLRNPSDYHYRSLTSTFDNNSSKEDFINNFYNNPNFKTKEELYENYKRCITELKEREELMNKYKVRDNIHIITISNYIEENYLTKLLLWSVNHPTKYIFHNLAEQILNILKLDISIINRDIDSLSNNERCLLYKCLENIVEFKLSDYTPRLSAFNIENANEIIDKYWETYSELEKS